MIEDESNSQWTDSESDRDVKPNHVRTTFVTRAPPTNAGKSANTDGESGTSFSESELNGREMAYWCYLMINFNVYQKTNTHVGMSRNPVKKVEKHNEKKLKGSKSTKAAAGSWELNAIVGPFKEKLDAKGFKIEWNLHSRGIDSRRNRGMQLCIANNLDWYDYSLPENAGATDDNAPDMEVT